MDLRYVFEAEGEFTLGEDTQTGSYKEEVSIFAPLPLLGLNFSWAFTPKWSLSTKVQLVGGCYEDVSAGVLATSMNARYKLSKHWGILAGLTYFNANITIEDDKDKQEIAYGYDGAFIGVHVGF